MKLRLSRRARRDVDAIRSALTMLAAHPQAGCIVGKGLYRFAVPRLPYLVFYKVDAADDAVQIVTVRHAPRREEH